MAVENQNLRVSVLAQGQFEANCRFLSSTKKFVDSVSVPRPIAPKYVVGTPRFTTVSSPASTLTQLSLTCASYQSCPPILFGAYLHSCHVCVQIKSRI